MVERPVAGLHYPAATGEFMAWFSTDADCLDYLEWLRWPAGFACPACGQGGRRLGDGRFECAGCGRRSSVTAGTIFDRTRTPLTVWFTACWQFAAAKDGISALSLQRSLEIGSYQTAWAMLHRLRSVLVRPGRERLTGVVEVDETYMGGEEPGLRGGRAKGKKLLVGIAVERRQPRGLGRCRMAVLPDAKTDTLRTFLADHVEEGATSSRTAGSPTERPPQPATSTGGSPAPAGRRIRRCPACTESPRWPSGGCSAPTRAPRTTPTCPATSTSSSSASTAAAHEAAAWSSTASSISPSLTSPCATETSCSTRGSPRAHDSHPAHAASRPPWSAHRPDGRGEGDQPGSG